MGRRGSCARLLSDPEAGVPFLGNGSPARVGPRRPGPTSVPSPSEAPGVPAPAPEAEPRCGLGGWGAAWGRGRRGRG